MTQRIQLRRVKGWRLPPGAVSVARPSRWGNPFRVTRVAHARFGRCWEVRGCSPDYTHFSSRAEANGAAVDLYRLHLGPMGSIEPDNLDEWLAPLVGHDLACWCPLTDAEGAPVACHADVLLELLDS